MNGVVLTFESGMTSGAFEDGISGSWAAEAQRGGVPYAEGSGATPLDAVMSLAQQLAAMISADRVAVALARVEDAVFEAEVALTPEQIAAKERVALRRAEQAAAGGDA